MRDNLSLSLDPKNSVYFFVLCVLFLFFKKSDAKHRSTINFKRPKTMFYIIYCGSIKFWVLNFR